MATPSYVLSVSFVEGLHSAADLVPRPSSSRMTSVRGVMVRRISLVSDNSTMKVDLPRPISSDAMCQLDHSSGAVDRPPIRLCSQPRLRSEEVSTHV